MRRIGLALLLGAVFAVPAKSDDAIAKHIVKGNTQFALEMYAKLPKDKGNVFFSPFSISTALSMTSLGAKGDTLTQMQEVLHFPNADVTHAGYAALIQQLNNEKADPKTRGYELSVANALWGQQGAKWLPTFLEESKKFYGAGLTELDFTKTEAARKTINTWVEEKTHDKIKDIIQPSVLQPDTQMVLANAIYFKGRWAAEFDKKLTKAEPFFLSADKSEKRPLMHKTANFRYAETAALQVLELPYKGKELSMIVLLPKAKDGLGKVEKTLGNYEEWIAALKHEREVIVTLPKFKITSDFNLEEELPKLGMTDLFVAGKADLSGMNGDRNLFIRNVIHRAFVDVNEEGTEAVAATIIGGVPRSGQVNPTPVFRADHPFLFVIRDNRSGSLLFVGRVVDPK